MPDHYTRRRVPTIQRRLFVGVVGAAVVSLVVTAHASRQSDLDPDDGQRLVDKLADLFGREAAPVNPDQPVIIFQREINAYLRFQGAAALPAGVTDPDVTLRNGGVVAVRAIVDLSIVRDARPRGLFDPLGHFVGRFPVTVDGVVRTKGGLAHIDIELVTIGGVPIPSSVFVELVRYYSRSEQYLDGVDVSDPFDLPYGMPELRVEHEKVVVEH
jgi:hypothetical protein